MSRFLPVFPLNLVVFPGEELNLHIFEPRYKELILESFTQKSTFGIPPFVDNKMALIGTEIELVAIEKTYPDGQMDVRTKGIGIFDISKIIKSVPDKLYSGADIEDRHFEETGGKLANKKKLLELLTELFKVMRVNKTLPDEYHLIRTFRIANQCGLNIYQKLELLQIGSESERELFLIKHFEQLIPTVKEMESLRQRIQMNGHFKNIIPPKF